MYFIFFSCLWAKVHIILEQGRAPIIVSHSSILCYISNCHQVSTSLEKRRPDAVVGTNPGPIFRRLWTNVHEIPASFERRSPLSTACFIRR